MKKLHVFILRSFIGPLVLTFFITMFILLMQFLWKYIDDLVGKGLESGIIAELLIYASATLVPMALPLAILLASLMTFGNLGEYYELTAIKAAGISLQRAMMPQIVLVVILSIGAFFFSNHMLPRANLKFHSLLYSVKQQSPEFQIRPGMFDNTIDKYSLKIDYKDTKTGLLRKILIYDHSDNKGNAQVTYADSGYMNSSPSGDKLILTLYQGNTYTELEDNRKRRNERTFPHRREQFEKQIVIIPMDQSFNRTDEDLFRNNYHMLNLGQLEYTIDSLKEKLDSRKDDFTSHLLRTSIFNKERRTPKTLDTNTVETIDSIPAFVYEFNADSIFMSLEKDKRARAIDMALSFTNSSRSTIDNNSQEIKSKRKNIKKHQVEWHRKFTLSFACLVFFFIGAPLGAIIRKGGLGTPVIISVLFFILYYIIDISGQKLVKEGDLEAYFGTWISSIILMPLGIFLTYKATTDSSIMSLETYANFIKKFVDKVQQVFRKQFISNEDPGTSQ